MDLSKARLSQVEGKDYKLATLPWGALEPHNRQLPYMTDALLSQAVAVEAVEKSGVDVLVLPPVWLGQQNPGQTDYPGCVHTRQLTQAMIIEDIVRSLMHQGIKTMLIINGHGGNNFKGIIRDMAFTYPDFKIYSTEWFAIVPEAGFFENSGEHAHELETSAALHYFPELVEMADCGEGKPKPHKLQSLAQKIAWAPRNWKDTTNDTGIGDPRKATAEKGKKYTTIVTDKLAQLIKEIC